MNTSLILKCMKLIACVVLLSLHLCGTFVPGWRIRSVDTLTNGTQSLSCPRIGLCVAEICSRENCDYVFIPSMKTEQTPDENPTTWTPHLVLGTIGLLSSLITCWLIWAHTVRPRESTSVSTVDLLLYTFACLSGICSIIPMTDVLNENKKLQEQNNLTLKSPYSLIMFGMGGFSMIVVAAVSIVSNLNKCLPLGALAFPYVGQIDNKCSSNTTVLTVEQHDNHGNYTVDHVRRKPLNKAMVLVVGGLFVSNVLTIISLATTGWIQVKDMHCEGRVQYGLFSNDLCEFSKSVKVESLLAYFFNVIALASAFLNRPSVWRRIRALSMFMLFACQLFSAVITLNVAVHVLIIPQEQLDKSVVVAYSLYIYGVASLLTFATSLVTITYVIHNCLPENHVKATDNTVSNASSVVLDANMQEHTNESASTTESSAYLALAFDDTQEHFYEDAFMTVDDVDTVKYDYELIPITILKQGLPKDGFVRVYTKQDTLAPSLVPTAPPAENYELYF